MSLGHLVMPENEKVLKITDSFRRFLEQQSSIILFLKYNKCPKVQSISNDLTVTKSRYEKYTRPDAGPSEHRQQGLRLTDADDTKTLALTMTERKTRKPRTKSKSATAAGNQGAASSV